MNTYFLLRERNRSNGDYEAMNCSGYASAPRAQRAEMPAFRAIAHRMAPYARTRMRGAPGPPTNMWESNTCNIRVGARRTSIGGDTPTASELSRRRARSFSDPPSPETTIVSAKRERIGRMNQARVERLHRKPRFNRDRAHARIIPLR
jgi:hypothetical protein